MSSPETNYRPADYIVAALEAVSIGSVLDVGCGQGKTALYFARLGFTVDALDMHAPSLEKLETAAAAESLSVTTIHEDMAAFQPQKQYNIVIADKSLYFMEYDAIKSTVQALQEATVPGGVHAASIWSDENIGESPRLKLGRYALFNLYEKPDWKYQKWRSVHDDPLQIFHAVTAQKLPKRRR